jgi:thiamine monophosphate kinase
MKTKKEAGLSQLGEFGFIDRMSRPFLKGLAAGVEGIGDDCAVLPWTKSKRLIVTTDLLIEDRHFIRKGAAAGDLGWKSLAVNLSDIAAMGGRPKWALLSLGIPAGIDLDWLDGFFKGWRAAARPWGVSLVGGDTTKSPGGVVINVMVIGEVRAGREKYRSGARTGDVIAVTGVLGDSGGGLKILLARQGRESGKKSGEPGDIPAAKAAARRVRTAVFRVIPGGGKSEAAPDAGSGAKGIPNLLRIPAGVGFRGGKPEVYMLSLSGWEAVAPNDRRAKRDEELLIRAHMRPRPHIEEGEWLAGQAGVRAMMDVSDGIDSDVRRIMERSRVGASIDLARLPVSPELRRVAERRGFDAVETAAAGGEDYCLLATIEKGKFGKVAAGFRRRFKRPLTAIGTVLQKSSGLSYFFAGRPARLRARGYDHFK